LVLFVTLPDQEPVFLYDASFSMLKTC